MAKEIEVNGEILEFPDSMSDDQIRAVLQRQFGQPQQSAPAADPAPQPEPFKANAGDWLESGLQGLTFGYSDELQGRLASLFGQDYETVRSGIDQRQQQFRRAHPIGATAAEIGGGLLTGGLGGARLLASQAYKNAPLIGKVAGISGLGAAEGGVYGSGSAQPGERLSGAASGSLLGAAAAPVVGGAVNAGASLLGRVGGPAVNALVKTPSQEAIDMLRGRAREAGLSPDTIADRYAQLGPQGALMDVDDTFRGSARALFDEGGEARSQMRNFVERRQTGQIDRLKDATRGAISGDDGVDTVRRLAGERQAKAAPLYQEAWLAQPSEAMVELAESRGSLKNALAAGRKLAEDAGDAIEAPGDFKTFHYAKMAIDDQIETAVRAGEGQRVRSLMTLKNDLLAAMDEASPSYGQARQIYADDSALISAVDKGRKAFNMNTTVREFNDLVDGLTDGEMEMLRVGAAQAILEKLDNTQLTHDAAKKLINTPALRSKLGRIFPTQDDAAAFITQAARESAFTQTRNAMSGSMTSSNLAAKQSLQRDLGNMGQVGEDFFRGNLLGAARGGINGAMSLFREKGINPETANAAAAILMRQGMTREQVQRIFDDNGISQVLTNRFGTVYGGAAPATQGLLGGDQ